MEAGEGAHFDSKTNSAALRAFAELAAPVQIPPPAGAKELDSAALAETIDKILAAYKSGDLSPPVAPTVDVEAEVARRKREQKEAAQNVGAQETSSQELTVLDLESKEVYVPAKDIEKYMQLLDPIATSPNALEKIKELIAAEYYVLPETRSVVEPMVAGQKTFDSTTTLEILRSMPETRGGVALQLLLLVKLDPALVTMDAVLRWKYTIFRDRILSTVPHQLQLDPDAATKHLLELIVVSDAAAVAYISSGIGINLLYDELSPLRAAIVIRERIDTLNMLCTMLISQIEVITPRKHFMQYLRDSFGHSADSIYSGLIMAALLAGNTEAFAPLRSLLYETTRPLNVVISDNPIVLGIYKQCGWVTVNASRVGHEATAATAASTSTIGTVDIRPYNREASSLIASCIGFASFALIRALFITFNYGRTSLPPLPLDDALRPTIVDTFLRNDVYHRYVEHVKVETDGVPERELKQIKDGSGAIRLLLDGCQTSCALIGRDELNMMIFSQNTRISEYYEDNEFAAYRDIAYRLRESASIPVGTDLPDIEIARSVNEFAVRYTEEAKLDFLKTLRRRMPAAIWIGTIFYYDLLHSMKRLIKNHPEILPELGELLRTKMLKLVHKSDRRFVINPSTFASACTLLSCCILHGQSDQNRLRFARTLVRYFMPIFLTYTIYNSGRHEFYSYVRSIHPELVHLLTQYMNSASNPIYLICLTRNHVLLPMLRRSLLGMYNAMHLPKSVIQFMLYELIFQIIIAAWETGSLSVITEVLSDTWLREEFIAGDERDLRKIQGEFIANINLFLHRRSDYWCRTRERDVIFAGLTKNFSVVKFVDMLHTVTLPVHDIDVGEIDVCDPACPAFNNARINALIKCLLRMQIPYIGPEFTVVLNRIFHIEDGDVYSDTAAKVLLTIVVMLMQTVIKFLDSDRTAESLKELIAAEHDIVTAKKCWPLRLAFSEAHHASVETRPGFIGTAREVDFQDSKCLRNLLATAPEMQTFARRKSLAHVALQSMELLTQIFANLSENNAADMIARYLCLYVWASGDPTSHFTNFIAIISRTINAAIITKAQARVGDFVASLKSVSDDQKRGIVIGIEQLMKLPWMIDENVGAGHTLAKICRLFEVVVREHGLYEYALRVHDYISLPKAIWPVGKIDPIIAGLYKKTFPVDAAREFWFFNAITGPAVLETLNPDTATSSDSSTSSSSTSIEAHPKVALSLTSATGSASSDNDPLPIDPKAPGTRKFTAENILAVAKQLNVDMSKVSADDLVRGLKVELEHGSDTPFSQTNVTNDDLKLTMDIAVRHMAELPDYYSPSHRSPTGTPGLEEWEDQKKEYWAGRNLTEAANVINSQYWNAVDAAKEAKLLSMLRDAIRREKLM